MTVRRLLYAAAVLGFCHAATAPRARAQQAAPDRRTEPAAAADRAAGPARYVHERWTVRDGLPVNGVRRLLQGADGYLWLATWDGLVRFDGVRFTVYSTSTTDALPSNRLVDLAAGADGALWIRTEQNHLVRLRDGVLTHFDETRGLPGGGVHALYLDRAAQVWAAAEHGVYRLAGDRFERVVQVGDVADFLLHARDGALWVGTRSGGALRVRGDTVQRFDDVTILESRRITGLGEDATGTIWIATTSGVARFHDGRLEPAPEDWRRGSDLHVALDQAPWGDVWLATLRGLSTARGDRITRRYDHSALMRTLPVVRFRDGVAWYAIENRLYRDGTEVFRVPPEDGAGTLPLIYDFTWDHEGSIWLGSYNSGVYRVKPTAFTVYSVAEGLPGANATVTLQDRSGTVWIGTRDAGLGLLDGGTVRPFPPSANAPAVVLALMQDLAGDVWVGGAGARRCSAVSLRCAPPEAGTADVFALHQDRRGGIWAGTTNGLLRRGPTGWDRVAEAELPGSSIVRAFLETPDGTLWMGSSASGLLAWRDGRFFRITTADGLPSDLIRALHYDGRGHLWVGTEGRGLARITLQPGQTAPPWSIAAVRQRDGLFDEVIHRIIADDAGRLWMSTNRGIFWVRESELDAFADGRTARVWSRSYTERDGLRNREANGGSDPAGMRSRDGRIWFPTQDGAVAVDPSRITGDQPPPRLVVENVATGRRDIDPRRGPVELQPDERDFEIDYTALSFLAPQGIRFRYRLTGFSDGWTEVDHRRRATFTRVPPGSYTFELVASNGEGLWPDVSAALPLRVVPRFAETRTAFGLLVLAVIGLAVAGYRWRVRQLRRRARELGELVDRRTAQLREREQQLTQLDEAKSRLFANLSHEFRTPLTLIIGPLQGLLDGRHGALPDGARSQSELMLRSARRLLRLINQILDLSRLQSAAVRLDRQPHDLVGFVRGTVLAFAPLAERRGIALEFRSGLERLDAEFDPEQLEKVVVNLVSNALKFTGAGGSVVTAVGRENGTAEIAVRDTGVGIGAAELPHVFDRFFQADASATRRYEGTGIGLALVRELVQLHGGTVRVESAPGAGSTFTVALPIREVAAARAADGGRTTETLAGEIDEPDEPRPAVDDADEDRTTVLIVDDNADVRAYVRSVLAPSYRILEAADGVAGLELARTALPDLIVADVMMPGLDGLGLVGALRTDRMTDALPVVLLTARAASEDQVAGLATGADAYLVKPFEPAVLEAQVANLLAQRSRLRERFRDGEAAPPAAPVPAPSALEQTLRPLVENRLHDPELGPVALAEAAGLSYHQLYRALREELGTTPSRFIRTVRVECAAELLARRAGSITEIAYSVGFESLSYFSRAFRERYGCAPSEHTAVPTA